jgi:hypothetical protein
MDKSQLCNLTIKQLNEFIGEFNLNKVGAAEKCDLADVIINNKDKLEFDIFFWNLKKRIDEGRMLKNFEQVTKIRLPRTSIESTSINSPLSKEIRICDQENSSSAFSRETSSYSGSNTPKNKQSDQIFTNSYVSDNLGIRIYPIQSDNYDSAPISSMPSTSASSSAVPKNGTPDKLNTSGAVHNGNSPISRNSSPTPFIEPPSLMNIMANNIIISSFTAKQLKFILRRENVSFQGTIEKIDLVDKVNLLIKNIRGDIAQFNNADLLCKVVVINIDLL